MKVALAGDGGDEVFGGYSRYAWDPVAARLGVLGPLARLLPERGGRKNVVRRASKLLKHAAKPDASRYLSWFALMDGDARAHVFERLFEEAPDGLTKLGRLQWVDLESFVTDNLMLKADKLSMAHSLELRVPLLDHLVVESGLALPDSEKIRGVRTKVAIRRIVEQRLGRSIARRPKQGLRPAGRALAPDRPARPRRRRDRCARRPRRPAPRRARDSRADVRADDALAVADGARVARA